MVRVAPPSGNSRGRGSHAVSYPSASGAFGCVGGGGHDVGARGDGTKTFSEPGVSFTLWFTSWDLHTES